MIYKQIHTIRDLDNIIQSAQLTGVQKEFDEKPDYVCIHDNEDGTFIYEEWVQTMELNSHQIINPQVGYTPCLLTLII